jgi:hypothetical protein
MVPAARGAVRALATAVQWCRSGPSTNIFTATNARRLAAAYSYRDSRRWRRTAGRFSLWFSASRVCPWASADYGDVASSRRAHQGASCRRSGRIAESCRFCGQGREREVHVGARNGKCP